MVEGLKFGISADLLMFYNAAISSSISFGVGMFQNVDKGGWIKSYIEPVGRQLDNFQSLY